MEIQDTLDALAARDSLPDGERYLTLLYRTIAVLERESPELRPPDSTGLSGGLVRLKKDLPTLIVPDLHARVPFFRSLMDSRVAGDATVLEAMGNDTLQVLCLGDGFHSEGRGRKRWAEAFQEYSRSFTRHRAMDAEMSENLALMEMVMQCKLSFPRNFHFLKGNHENIMNEEGGGNHAFRKFALEGSMVRAYMEMFFGTRLLELFALFEKRLPLFAIGGNFLASHAEPLRAYTETELIEARNLSDVILGLTWTNNDEAEPAGVNLMLDRFLGAGEAGEHAVYFGGHRPVPESYLLRSGDRYVQFHNPGRYNYALVWPDRPFDPEVDIRELT